MTPSSDRPFVERQAALDELRALVSEYSARGEAAVIRIAGSSGIGKTEFLRVATTQLGVGSKAWAAATPLDAATPGTCARRLRLSLQRSAGLTRPTLAAAMTICVDDVQWIDEGSLREIEREAHRRSELLVFFTDRRDEAPEMFPHRTLHLYPISDEASAEIVRSIHPRASDELIGSIVRNSSGSPFTLTVLASAAAHEASRSSQFSPSVRVTVAQRLTRARPEERRILEASALIQGDADLRPVARACDARLTDAAQSSAAFSDLVEIDGVRLRFRHALLREAVAAGVADPIGIYRRLQAAYLEERHAADRAATIVQCAIASGDDSVVASTALEIARRAAGSGAAADAVRFLTIAMQHAELPLSAEYGVEYATALQHLGRDADAATFLRAQLRDAIDARDARRAARLARPFASATLSLERQAEFSAVVARIEALSDAAAAPHLRTARLLSSAFSGDFTEYQRIAAGVTLSAADLRIAAFVAALSGEENTAREFFERYEAHLGARDNRQEPADRVLQAVIRFHASGASGLSTFDDIDVNSLGPEAYRASVHLQTVGRIYDGRWAAARATIESCVPSDARYEEPFFILEPRLALSALSGYGIMHPQRTLQLIHEMIARGQRRHASSAARWYIIAAERGAAPDDNRLSDFVGATLSIAPMPYSLSSLPLAVALLAGRFGALRCVDALEGWPEYGSRWHRTNLRLANALLRSDRDQLRDVRDELERLGCDALAMIPGLELPVPRARDVELSKALGYAREREQDTAVLTPREQDVAELVAQDLPNRAVAQRLGISERTVEVHLTNLYRKLNVRSRSGLARLVQARRLRN